MFEPPLFREQRPEVMHALMHAHPFATLVSKAGGRLMADHLPLVVHPELSENGVLRGHVAAGNPLAGGGREAREVLAIFQGPQVYVTPSWYPSKAEHGKVVPTWNYAVVHAYGMLRFHADRDWLLAHLTELTARNERDRPEPWAVSDAPEEFVDRQIKGIVGVEIAVETLTGKWKVSQNRDARDREGVEHGLLAEGGEAMSALVRRYGK